MYIGDYSGRGAVEGGVYKNKSAASTRFQKHVSQQGKRNNLLEGRSSYDNVSMELLEGKGARVCCKLMSVEEPAPKSVGSNYDDVSD
ncbi:hypothetical protein ACHAXS_007888 [Conticribra weissflogii]